MQRALLVKVRDIPSRGITFACLTGPLPLLEFPPFAACDSPPLMLLLLAWVQAMNFVVNARFSSGAWSLGRVGQGAPSAATRQGAPI